MILCNLEINERGLVVWRTVCKRGSVPVVVPVCPPSRLDGAPAGDPFYTPALVSCVPYGTCVDTTGAPSGQGGDVQSSIWERRNIKTLQAAQSIFYRCALGLRDVV